MLQLGGTSSKSKITIKLTKNNASLKTLIEKSNEIKS